MNLSILTESIFEVDSIDKSDFDALQEACDLINDGGQLSWSLDPSRIISKLGNIGQLFGLYNENSNMVGVIGLKETKIDNITGVEIGYLYIDPEYRSLRNATLLYNKAITQSNKYPFIIASTNVTNKNVNSLLSKSSKMEFVFIAKSPYSSNKLNYWISSHNNGSVDVDDIKEKLQEKHSNNIINESNMQTSGSLTFLNVEDAPESFQKLIYGTAKSSKLIKIDDYEDGDIKVLFGRREGLPTELNTIFIGNKFFNKEKQYNILKEYVPTIKTYPNTVELQGDFIAKKKTGHKQDGQKVNEIPDNSDDYVYQPLLDIKAEYRIVVYYMNGDYHVSGIYKKTGKNASFQSITGGSIQSLASDISIAATQALGYGLSGVDVAIVEKNDGINESVGDILSNLGKVAGKFGKQGLNDDEHLVVIECNTLPSMSNPMIMHDTITSIFKNKR